MKDSLLKTYAELIIKRGVGLTSGDILVIEEASVSAVEFIRVLTKVAFENGAKDVIVHLDDSELTKIRLENASLSTLADVPKWWVESRTMYMDRHACYLRLIDEAPDVYADVDKDKLAAWKSATSLPLKQLGFVKKDNKVKWSALALPGKKWAMKVYPGIPEQEAVGKLWDAILKACYIDENRGITGWDEHVENMQVKVKEINSLKLKSLIFRNSLGTSISMDLCSDAIFAGGICHCPEPDGDLFAPNIPTEEILTTPDRRTASGVVYSSMPFVYAGNIVDGVRLEFYQGRVVDYSAKIGEDVLTKIVEMDEGSCRLGEVALVPQSSPINQMKTLFYNTLFDENAACHMALGAGYTDMILGEDRSEEALREKGLNSSSIHVDFMFGTADLSCTGVAENGNRIQIFEGGEFCI